jgi:glycine/D-amino acid oxidase-like deaminating enzyme
MISNAHVKYLNEREGRITGVTTAEESLDADEVIIAAGIGSARLLHATGITLKMEQPPGLLVHTKPAPEILKGLIISPEVHVRQTPDGHLIAGSDFSGADPGEDPEQIARGLFAKLQSLLAGGESLTYDRYTVGLRPSLPDGIPALGRPMEMPGLYLAVTHSGITLAPVIGQIVAREILNGERDASLARYHPGRVLA